MDSVHRRPRAAVPYRRKTPTQSVGYRFAVPRNDTELNRGHGDNCSNMLRSRRWRAMKRSQLRRSGGPVTRIRLAADIGGTFTDVAVFDDRTGALAFGKALSTPRRLVDGISEAVAKAGSDYASAGLFLHGSTIAINTILERTGARTALVTTEGFRDVYEIGRINRPDSYNLFFGKHVPLVERALRFEVKERVLADGEVLVALEDEEIERLGERLA